MTLSYWVDLEHLGKIAAASAAVPTSRINSSVVDTFDALAITSAFSASAQNQEYS